MAVDRILAPKWHEVVRANHPNTLGLVVAKSGQCLKIQHDEKHLVPGRGFRPLPPQDLLSIDLGESWYVGVLLCPGDETQAVTEWAAALSRSSSWRIRFYHVDGVDLPSAMAAWREAGLRGVPILRVAGFRAFHKLYGRHHGDVVYRDATRGDT